MGFHGISLISTEVSRMISPKKWGFSQWTCGFTARTKSDFTMDIHGHSMDYVCLNMIQQTKWWLTIFYQWLNFISKNINPNGKTWVSSTNTRTLATQVWVGTSWSLNVTSKMGDLTKKHFGCHQKQIRILNIHKHMGGSSLEQTQDMDTYGDTRRERYYGGSTSKHDWYWIIWILLDVI